MQNPSALKPRTFDPNWAEMMKVLGTPNQEAVYVNRSMDPESMDGAWDHKAAQRGIGMRRVAADIGKSNGEVEAPSGFVFICGNCGYARRVVDSEVSFSCERPNATGAPGCGVIWEQQMYESDDINEKTGMPKWKPVLEERTAPQTGRKYMMPKIKGRLLVDMQRETWKAKKEAGKPMSYQPQTFGEKSEAPAEGGEPFVVPEAPKPTVGGA